MQVIRGDQPNNDRSVHPANSRPIALAADVRSRLLAGGLTLDGHDLMVLPPYQRDDKALYGSADIEAVRLARTSGIKAAFLHRSDERQYNQEYSAGYVVEFAVAISAHFAAIGFISFGDYIRKRARQAVEDGLDAGPEENVTVRMTLAHFERDPEGAISLKGLNIEGSCEAVTEAVRHLFDSGAQAFEKVTLNNPSQIPPMDPQPPSIEQSANDAVI